MTIRNINQVMDQMRESLLSSDSELADFPEFGNLYAIFRAVAGLVVEQDNKIQTLDDTLFLDTASGNFLDQKAKEFGVERRLGVSSSGNIIINGPSTTIPVNTILTHQPSNLQFRVTDRVSIVNNRGFVNVESLLKSREANLQAGIQLRSSLFPELQFIVGNKFNPLFNRYEGDLLGGASSETDAELRSRVKSTIQNLANSTIQSISSAAVNTAGVSKATVVENSPSIGYITVYINNNNQDVYRRLKNNLNNIKPIGTAIIIKSYEILNIDINLSLATTNGNRDNLLNREIRNEFIQYFNNITGPALISPETLAAIVLNTNEVFNININQPNSNIEIKSFQIPRLNNLSINYVN